MKLPMIDFKKMPKYDNLYTPEVALQPLLPYLPKNTSKVIWECCDPGHSNITKVLRDQGYSVVTSDIRNGFDFLTDEPSHDFDLIITNPPYSLKDQFLERCYQHHRPFALLLPLTALEGKRRSILYRKYGISVIVPNKRIEFTGKNANWFAVAWFCWNILKDNSLIFMEIP